MKSPKISLYLYLTEKMQKSKIFKIITEYTCRFKHTKQFEMHHV